MPNASDVVQVFHSLDELTMEDDHSASVTMPSIELSFGHLFGGQVFSQAFHACQLWLLAQKSKLRMHMSHGVFLKAGNPARPVTYEVTPLGLGRTFQRFQVSAFQEGTLIFQSFGSAQYPESPFVQHQQAMPQVAPPDGLLTDQMLKEKLTGKKSVQGDRPIEIRVATPDVFSQAASPSSRQGFWFRYLPRKGGEAEFKSSLTPVKNQALLAFASDYGFLGAIFIPHDLNVQITPYFLTSLDHGLWYYGDYAPADWAYFESETPVAHHGRGCVIGRVFQQDQMIAVVTQEGLLRRRD